MDGTSIADAAGAVIVSVEDVELAPGVTDAGESAHVGIGDGPDTAQES
jgi:hypothetical protein